MMAQNALQHGKDPVDLFPNAHRLALSRPGRFAADVDNVGPILQHLEPVFDRCGRAVKCAAVRKGVRRGVQHSYHHGSLAQR
jgi:hypothetical protein